jgi:ferritin-like metal-binding protein YciE
MKTRINSVNDTLCHILQGLYTTEEKTCEAFRDCFHHLSSDDLRRELAQYTEESNNRILRLERIFNYLMQEQVKRRNDVISRMLDETHELMEQTSVPHLKDIIIISCLESISAYKIANYNSAWLFSAELELDTVCDLLQQSLESEMETKRNLHSIAMTEFNRYPV